MNVRRLARCPIGSDLRALRPYALAAVAILAGGMAAGVIVPVLLPETARSVGEGVDQFIGMARQLSQPELFLFIFLNNAVKALAMMYLGVVFGLVPVAFLFFNGMVIALVITGFALTVDAGTAAVTLLPHGILEIPAVVLAAAMGLRLGVSFARRLRSPMAAMGDRLAEAWRVFSRLIAPVLFVAAVIETWVTPAALRLLLP